MILTVARNPMLPEQKLPSRVAQVICRITTMKCNLSMIQEPKLHMDTQQKLTKDPWTILQLLWDNPNRSCSKWSTRCRLRIVWSINRPMSSLQCLNRGNWSPKMCHARLSRSNKVRKAPIKTSSHPKIIQRSKVSFKFRITAKSFWKIKRSSATPKKVEKSPSKWVAVWETTDLTWVSWTRI